MNILIHFNQHTVDAYDAAKERLTFLTSGLALPEKILNPTFYGLLITPGDSTTTFELAYYTEAGELGTVTINNANSSNNEDAITKIIKSSVYAHGFRNITFTELISE